MILGGYIERGAMAVILFLLLLGAGVVGMLAGLAQARPKDGQPNWAWKPIFLISVPSVLLVFGLLTLLVLLLEAAASFE